ncbi:hypothetical protein NFI96_027926 [Prochilodus magdalenae]|nr:hypothetical protein NFI96_027926 [Prochilodus magdalenae]
MDERVWCGGTGLALFGWSPDLNLIEHLWDELEQTLRARPSHPTSVSDLSNALLKECLFCFTETWLTTDTPDANVELPGFSTVRADRDPTLSGKRKGGGLALFINTRWCNPGHVNVKEVICCRDIELLAVSLRPYYMPRELSHAIVVCVYIPPRAEVQAACDVIHSTVAALQTQHPDAFYVISGDFNHVTLDSTLPAFFQSVDCPTRKNRTTAGEIRPQPGFPTASVQTTGTEAAHYHTLIQSLVS